MFPPYQSYPEDQLVESCKKLVQKEKEAGCSEDIKVMFQADSVGDYGRDTGSSLPKLIRRIVAIDPLVKVGLQGFNPAHFIEYRNDMIQLISEGRIFHIRIPIQSASARILKLMGRKYTIEDIEKVFNTFHELNYDEFSTDVIVGFPGETEEDFKETVNFITKHKPRYILLSAYMDFSRLPAYHLPNKVDHETKQRRLEEADRIFTGMGIYCSTDGGTMTDERRKRLNQDNRI
jgi:threonylcarbamoyladenosine tRNA methylthiotransferase MtaB